MWGGMGGRRRIFRGARTRELGGSWYGFVGFIGDLGGPYLGFKSFRMWGILEGAFGTLGSSMSYHVLAS